MPAETICIRGLEGIPEIVPGMNLAEEILSAWKTPGFPSTGNAGRSEGPGPLILVVAQKVVSKSEGCLIRLETIHPSAPARQWAAEHNKDARMVEVILQQSRRIVRMEKGVMIAETHHGYICANAGVDASNAPDGTVVLLPPDPDRSAARLRAALEPALGRAVAVIISDTFGRAWRIGQTNVALGISGLSPFLDYRGQVDSYGRSLRATTIAVADELAGAAELVMRKAAGIPVAVIDGFFYMPAEGSGRELIRPADQDLFR